MCYNSCMFRELRKILVALSSRGEGKFQLMNREIFIFENEQGFEIATRVLRGRQSEIRNFCQFTRESSLAIKNYEGEGVYFLYQVSKVNWRVLKNYLEEVENWCKILN